ncbi:hypothetical protein [Noviherbaspirillum pedocola]|uniref:Uncharacterized protein n=1 Tax=Noviherbaspirillum pedocola TaxID=2801341 RepID=A0A934W1E5_9BURK|nr:hypothetical protein [Noviherbaspirillum pedocola]MBK4735086.1 hypothetical protein [Noviherbaspirillum pedocola]
MAGNTKNKYPADKAGTKYSEFRNTKRVSPGKTATTTTRAADKESKSTTGAAANTANAA